MRFALRGYFELSDVLSDDAVGEVRRFLGEIGDAVFKKGAPRGKEDEAARLISWDVRGNRFYVEVESGRYVRAHVAFVRLRNALAEFLGSRFGLGVRGSRVEEYVLEFELDREPLEPVNVLFAKDVRFDGRKVTILLEDLDDVALERNYPDRIIGRVREKVARQFVSGKGEFTRVVRRSNKGVERYVLKEDPTDLAIRFGWVKEYPATGVWQIMPPMAALIRAMEKLIVDEVAKPLGFQEVMMPRLIPLEVEYRKGHFGIANEIIWACPPVSRDPKDFEDLVDYVEITGGPPPAEFLREKLRPPLYGLSYAQCEPFYEMFHRETVDLDALEEEPIKFYDRNGPTYRWESGGVRGLERLNEFHRVEFVFLSTPRKCIEIRDSILERTERIVDEVFDLEYRVDATTAVYLEHAGKMEEEGGGDFVKTYDLTAILPFQTKSRPEAELEIASFHVHTDFYAKRFHFRDKKRRTVFTGCAGLGPSRFAYVFLVRYGFDFENWPNEIKKYIGEKLPEPPRMLTWPKG
ncbi:MAG: aminoacyl--tRNA ligase-related protein [Candidatus Freyarchaeota archaeon]|nr:aminoacyl--tRNA ligase-related protein [Candidatus Freyrarchaeum guaymaensis]